ncbi:hypothetical protein ABK040_012688 [Willaertia magna]
MRSSLQESSSPTNPNWFTFSSTGDVIFPNYLSPEIYNLFIAIIYAFIIYWFYRLLAYTFSNLYLLYVIRSGSFNIVNIANFANIDNIWGEGGIRAYVQALFRDNIESPSIKVKRVNGTIHLKKSSIECIKKENNRHGIKFQFDSLVNCSVQLFWGVSEVAFKKKILKPFKEQYERKLNQLNNEENEQQDNVYDEDERLLELDDVNNRNDNRMNNLSQIDMNELLNYEEFTEKSDLTFFEKNFNNQFEMNIDEMFDNNTVDNYFISLPVRQQSTTTTTNNTTNTTDNNEEHNEQNEEGVITNNENIELRETEEERLGNQLTQDLLMSNEDNNLDFKLPLIIILKPTSKQMNDFIKRYEDEDPENDYDSELNCVYIICNFKRYENNEEGVYYRVNVVKFFVQTENELFELDEVYGADENDPNEVEECIVCFTDPREIILLPCRHKCVCRECFKRIDKCPICRSNVRSFLNIKGEEESIEAHHHDHHQEQLEDENV